MEKHMVTILMERRNEVKSNLDQLIHVVEDRMSDKFIETEDRVLELPLEGIFSNDDPISLNQIVDNIDLLQGALIEKGYNVILMWGRLDKYPYFKMSI